MLYGVRQDGQTLIGPILARLADPDEHRLSPDKVAALLGVSRGELAKAAGVDRNTLARSPGNLRVQRLLSEIVRVLDRARSLTGDPDRAIVWFRHQPIEAYGFKTPQELVLAGHEDAVMAFLDDLEHGTYA